MWNIVNKLLRIKVLESKFAHVPTYVKNNAYVLFLFLFVVILFVVIMDR